MRRWTLRICPLLLALLILTGCGGAPAGEAETAQQVLNPVEGPEAESGAVRLQDDFYTAVNAGWLDTAELNGNQVSVGGFQDLTREIQDLLMADFAGMDGAEGALGEFLHYYALAADYAGRDEQGGEPLRPYIEKIQAIDSLAELDAVMADWVLEDLPLPFTLGVMADMGNAETYALYASDPGLFLPDVRYYGDPVGEQLLEMFGRTGRQLMLLAGFDGDEAEEVVEQAIAFDALLAPYAKTAEEAGAYTSMYNPVDMDTFAGFSDVLDLDGLAQALVGGRPEQVILTNPRYFAAMNQIVTGENLPLMKSWMLLNIVYSLSAYLSRDFLYTALSYGMLMTGQQEFDDLDELAYTYASRVFGEVVGDYYGRTYFGEEAKAEVTGMVENIIAMFKSRLQNNDWLSAETIAAALRKLDTMAVNIGYPDEIDPLYEALVVTPAAEGGTFLSNTMDFTRLILAESFARYGTRVDRGEWSMSADTVNAQYSPMQNAITFPAAILQAPFYSLEQSASANYGGIGAVIAHEITHAFDANGARFDEYGSLADWWTEEDYAAFRDRNEAMVALFDGLDYAGGSVSGQLTVSENTADAGGLACALEVVKSLPEGDLEAFFRNWAVIWRQRATPEYEQLLLALDVHAPNQLRANVQLANLDEFYEVFGVTEADGMYIPPENRVSIW